MSAALDGPHWFQARAISRGIDFLLKFGQPVNRMYTSTNLRRTAGNITGKTYPAGKRGLQMAMDDLNAIAPPPPAREASK